ncbi:MAG: HK97 family phage prohead protease [Anaerolineales bacterium]|nr:HK97 family phage prohead protease [Anaerolineales bacterium]
MADEMEFKAVRTEFKAAGDKGEYEGHFSVFGNVDDGADVVHPGAFLKTIAERANRVKVFFAHDFMKLIGPPPHTLREDSVGLFAAGRLTLDSFYGKEAWSLMKDGALTEGSFGYGAVKFDFEQNDQYGMVRNLRELKLYEISPVPLGMNGLTAIRAVKSAAERGDPADVLAERAAALAQVAAGLKEGRVLSAGNKEKVQSAIGALEGALEALNNLLAAAEPEKGFHSALLQKRLRAAGLALAIRTP